MNGTISNWGNVVGVFSDAWDLKSAIDELGYLGFSASQVGVATYQEIAQEIEAMGDVLARAVTANGMARRLLRISRGFPGIESALVAGTLAANLSHDPHADIVGLLKQIGVQGPDALNYENEFRKGQSLVTVNAGPRAAIARVVLKRVHSMS